MCGLGLIGGFTLKDRPAVHTDLLHINVSVLRPVDLLTIGTPSHRRMSTIMRS